MAALLVLVAAGVTGARAQGQAPSGPNVSYFTLANGLEVVVIPDRRTPVVTHMIWYKVGSADEPPGKSGIAHFLEHLMFKGTAKNPRDTFSRTVAAIGGAENAFTSSDYTGYFQRVAREHLAKMMELEADRMTGLILTDAVVQPELQVVLEEQNQRVANEPRTRLGEQVQAALYLNHPYGRPVIGWRNEIEQLTREDALSFYRQYYTPNNAILVVAGDVTADEVRELAEQTYGRVAPRSPLGPRVRPQEPKARAEYRVTLADARVAQPGLQRIFLVPSYATAKPGEAEALDVLAHLLGGGATSRLYRGLVVERGLATSAGAWYQGSALDQTRFGLYGSPRANTTLPQLAEAVDGIIADIVKNGITEEELTRAKTRMIADTVYDQDNQATLARWFGVALTTGLTVDAVRTWTERIHAVSAGAVQDAARRFLGKERSVTGFLVKDVRAEGTR
jgi:zinc protease